MYASGVRVFRPGGVANQGGPPPRGENEHTYFPGIRIFQASHFVRTVLVGGGAGRGFRWHLASMMAKAGLLGALFSYRVGGWRRGGSMACGVDDCDGRLAGGTLFARCWWLAGFSMAFCFDDGEGRLVRGTFLVRCWWVAGRGFPWCLASMMSKASLLGALCSHGVGGWRGGVSDGNWWR